MRKTSVSNPKVKHTRHNMVSPYSIERIIPMLCAHATMQASIVLPL